MEKMITYRSKKTLKPFFYTFFNFVVLFVLLFFTIFTFDTLGRTENWAMIVSILSISLLIYQGMQLYFRKIPYTDFRIWFILLLHIFMFGRVYLHAFNLDIDIFWDLMYRYPSDLLYKTGLYILLYIQAIFIGLMFKIKHRSVKTNKSLLIKISEDNETDRLLFNSGIILLLFSVLFRLYIDINSIIATQINSSYSAIKQHVGLADDFAILFVPSILLIISGTPKNKKWSIVFLCTSIMYFILVIILTGDRRYPVTGILAIMLCYLSRNNIKFSFMKMIPLLIGAGILLNILTVIRKIRIENLTSVFDFFSKYGKELFSLNIFYETLSEFGLSFFSVVAVIKYIPTTVSYLYGLTFIGSITSLAPVGFLFGEFYDRISVSSSTINKLDGYPVGATLAGDLYANFGWFSIFAAIIFGAALSNLFIFKDGGKQNYYFARYYSMFYILINLVRSSFFEIFRASFMVYIFPIIIMMLLKQRASKKNKRN
jgi:hypothetical protein